MMHGGQARQKMMHGGQARQKMMHGGQALGSERSGDFIVSSF
jgi:hypothetical protein